MTTTNTINTIPSLEAIGEIAIKHLKTSELIEMIARAEINSSYDFNSAGLVAAFTKTNAFPFSRSDVDFIKSCLQAEALQQSKQNWETAAKEGNTDLAKSELENYNRIRANIKENFKGLIYYKGGDTDWKNIT